MIFDNPIKVEEDKNSMEDVINLLDDLKTFTDEKETKELNIDLENLAIQSKEQANFFLKQLKILHEDKEEIENLAKNELKKEERIINEWKEQKLNSLNNKQIYLENLLSQFAINNIPKGKKSISLPHGNIGFKKQQPKYEYEDEKIIESLEKTDGLKHYIEYKPSVNKSELKKAGKIKDNKLYINNTVIDGIIVTEQEDKLNIKLNKDI